MARSTIGVKNLATRVPGLRLLAGRRSLSEFRVEASAVRPERDAGVDDVGALFFAHEGHEIHKWVHYLEVYERWLAPYRKGFPALDPERPVRVLELGVSQGGSLDLWRRYFGPMATIFGVDIDPRCAALDGVSGSVRIGSQDDGAFLRAVVEEMGGVDIVLDDGSHVAKHQRRSFETLFPLLSDGGLYLVEDLHTSYWWRGFGGGYRRRGTFIEFSKALVDGMHRWYHGHRGRYPAAKTLITAVAFYDSLVVIEKRIHGKPAVTKVGTQMRSED